ncbi:hypothetical protein GCM10020220_031530 [Nonomuraea rubra]
MQGQPEPGDPAARVVVGAGLASEFGPDLLLAPPAGGGQVLDADRLAVLGQQLPQGEGDVGAGDLAADQREQALCVVGCGGGHGIYLLATGEVKAVDLRIGIVDQQGGRAAHLPATAAGLTTKTIRFYEQAGLLPQPPRTPAGYRDCPAGAAERLAFIRDTQAAGLTLAEIRSVLAIRDAGQPPCHHVTTLIEAHLEQVEARIAELLATRTALQSLHQRARSVDPAGCGPEGICRILASA